MSGQGAPPYPIDLTPQDLTILHSLWGEYYEAQPFSEDDGRLQVVACLKGFFFTTGGQQLVKRSCDLSVPSCTATFDYSLFCDLFQVDDFPKVLYERAFDTLGCIGLALALLRRHLFPQATCDRITIRFTNIEPLLPIASLKSSTVGKFIAVQGTVVRCSAIRPLVLRACFECLKCGSLVPQHFPDGVFVPPGSCLSSKCRNKYMFELRRESAQTVDFQKIKIQEIDDFDAEPGRIPKTMEVELREDLVDSCIPGDKVTVAGVVKSISTDALAGKPASRAGKHQSLYLLYIHAVSLFNHRKAEGKGDDDHQEDAEGTFQVKHLCAIREIATDGLCFELLVASLCPAIFGHELVKAGLILTLMGGTKRDSESSNRTRVKIRSDPHILLVGDPGLGKSQLLRAASSAAPRSVYVCGNVVTSTGLTVTLVNEGRGDVGLEAGALVLSDHGVCCIDELDKLSCSYHALLEAMEQQQISIAKSGVVASLSARCSIIAAANPVGGHYHRGKTVSENLKMSGALFSRFDLVFIMLDRPDDLHDKRLSSHIVQMHRRQRTGEASQQDFPSPHAPSPNDQDRSEMGLSQRLRRAVAKLVQDPVPFELLRKYIAYARKYVHPRLSPEASRVLQGLYLKMRAEARQGRSTPITNRQLESLIRLAQARAKAELRDVVTADDAMDVVELMQESLLDAYTTETGEIDFSHHTGSMSLAKQVKAFVAQLNKESDRKATTIFQRADLVELAQRMQLKIVDFDRFLEVLNAECYLLKKGPKLYQVMTSNTSCTQR